MMKKTKKQPKKIDSLGRKTRYDPKAVTRTGKRHIITLGDADEARVRYLLQKREMTNFNELIRQLLREAMRMAAMGEQSFVDETPLVDEPTPPSNDTESNAG